MKESENSAIRVVAEIGCNHRGDFDTAVQMINVAADFCRVDAVKFQKRNPRTLLSTEEYDQPHPNPMHAYGSTYGLHREALEFSEAEHLRLMEVCEGRAVAYSSSVWDLSSAKLMTRIGPPFLKVPSACNQDYRMIDWLCDEFEGEIHVSLGMTTHDEEERLITHFDDRGRITDLVLYACTSGYPVAFEDCYLLEISRLIDSYGSKVASVGFSGHHLGIAADVAAMALGATWIERHFTLDRTWKGTDHAASLEPDGMRRLVRDVKNVSLAMRTKGDEMPEVELAQRRKLKRSIDH